jgi:ferredoxin
MIRAGVPVRERAHATRESILAAAERPFAEHGAVAESNRQMSEAAEQGTPEYRRRITSRRGEPAVTVDEATRHSAGNCVLLAPEVFDQREDDGTIVLLDERPAGHLRDAVRAAVAVCHAGTVHLSGAGGTGRRPR